MSNQLEQRVSALEAEVSKLKRSLEGPRPEKPWWEVIAGTFENDQPYREAMKLGAGYRHNSDPIPDQQEE